MATKAKPKALRTGPDQAQNLIRVLLADDHPLVRKGISQLLAGQPDIQVVGEAGSGVLALELVKALRPTVLVLDMEMPELNGLQVAERLKKETIKPPILALSAYDDLQYIRGLLTSGIAGYLVKDEAPQMILEAIRGVARGETGWTSRRVIARLHDHMKEIEICSGLSDRERQVVKIVAIGKTNAQIARDLGISQKTVEKHLRNIFDKLGVYSRAEAAVHVIRAGML